MQAMNNPNSALSGLTGSEENVANAELKAVLESWRAPLTPSTLIRRLDASYRSEMSKSMSRIRRPMNWALGIALTAAATVIWWTAMRLGPAPEAVQIAVPSGTVPGGADTRVALPKTPETKTDRGPAPQYRPLGLADVPIRSQQAAYLLTGQVKSEQGEPLPGAIVAVHDSKPYYLYDPSAATWPKPVVSQQCDSEGRYILNVKSPMHAFVTIRKEGFAQNEDEIDFFSPGIIIKNHRLRPARASIEGYVFDTDNNPIESAIVAVAVGNLTTSIPTSTSRISSIYSKTDASGRYVIPGVPEGRVSVTSGPNEHLLDYKSVQTTAGDCSRVDFYLQKALMLSFLVKNGRGEVLHNAMGSCKGQDFERMAVSHEKGLLKLGIEPKTGPFECTIGTLRGTDGYKTQTVFVDPNNLPVEVTLEEQPPQIVKGRVLTEWGEPIPAARIEINQWVVETDSEGRFQKAIQPSPGTAYIRIVKSSYLEYVDRISVNAAAPQSDLEIRLRQSEGGIYGRVLDESGRPIERFELQIS
jgi:protocatechuate 3,4-dioxygenase beta subunit